MDAAREGPEIVLDSTLGAGAAERPAGPSETIPVEGVFNAASAVDLQVAIERAAQRTSRLVVDFSAVRELRGLGLAVLGRLLAQLEGRGPRVVVRGLRERERALARSWGVGN